MIGCLRYALPLLVIGFALGLYCGYIVCDMLIDALLQSVLSLVERIAESQGRFK